VDICRMWEAAVSWYLDNPFKAARGGSIDLYRSFIVARCRFIDLHRSFIVAHCRFIVAHCRKCFSEQ
jgi:hypothetical protein